MKYVPLPPVSGPLELITVVNELTQFYYPSLIYLLHIQPYQCSYFKLLLCELCKSKTFRVFKAPNQ